MANANDMFDELLNEKESYFVPTDKPKTAVAPNVSGEFYGHLANATTKEVSWARNGSKYKAVVYNYDFKIAKENEGQSYTYTSWKDNSEQVSQGVDYVGRIYHASGVFRFLEPDKGDDFESNADGNKSYLLFCKTLGVDIPVKTVEMNGEKVDVQALPSLTASDINGKPAIAVIGKGKPYTNKDGQERTPYVVKFVKAWKDGVSDDIPF